MSDRNMELRRANYKQKSQFNAADVSAWWKQEGGDLLGHGRAEPELSTWV